jgi:hypothetical protein
MMAHLEGVSMMIFGKKLSDYVRFQWVILALIVVVGLLRLGLSMSGVANNTVKFFSMTVVGLAAIIYYGIRVHTSGFGSYKQLLPLLVIQSAVQNGIAILGILITYFTGRSNIFTAPEYGGLTRMRWHILGHALGGLIIGSLIGWAIASIVMWVTKRVSRKGQAQPATA